MKSAHFTRRELTLVTNSMLPVDINAKNASVTQVSVESTAFQTEIVTPAQISKCQLKRVRHAEDQPAIN